jgi:hypothetical protein
VLASPALASRVGSAGWGALACGAVIGADGAIAEMLTWGSLALSRPIVGARCESFLNPIAKMREIGAYPEGW